MPHYAYGAEHRRVRTALLATTPDGTPCPFAETDPKCPGLMYPGAELLDLHHSQPWMKAAGRPGDQLAHRACNRRASNRKVKPEVAARKERQAAKEQATLETVPPAPRCTHPYPLDREPRRRGCQCGEPFRVHEPLPYDQPPDGVVLTEQVMMMPNHYPPPCGGCGGYLRSRIW